LATSLRPAELALSVSGRQSVDVERSHYCRILGVHGIEESDARRSAP
jgi:hypothetical protein